MSMDSSVSNQLHQLRSLYPNLVSQLDCFLQSQREKSSSGSYQFEENADRTCLIWKDSVEGKQWIHGPENPIAQAQEWINSVSSHNTVIVWMAGAGYVPRILWETESNSRIVICENRLELIWEWLCRWDSELLLKSDRCMLISDESLLCEIQSLIQQYPQLFNESSTVIPGSVLTNDEQQSLFKIQPLLNGQIKEPPPQKNHAFCIMTRSLDNVFPAVLRGAESAGYSGFCANRPPALSGLLKDMNSWKETCGCIPEIALSFYRSLFNPNELMDMGRQGVKRVCWFYDRVYDLEPSLGDLYDLALTFDRSHLQYLRPIFGEKTKHLSAATGMDHFEPTGSIIPPTPVTFVGATGLRRSIQYLEQNRSVSMQLMQIINRIVSTGWEWSSDELQTRLFEETKHLNPANEPKFQRFVLQLAASRWRVSFLTAAQPFGLTIYGDALWGKREFSGNLFKSYAGYSLDYETQTPQVYAASSINVNLFHPQINEGIPMRVYDVLACGGFLLSQYRPILEEQFTVGKDLDVFHHPSEFAEKLSFYLKDEGKRKEVASHGKETVLNRHTYKHRIMQLCEWLD